MSTGAVHAFPSIGYAISASGKGKLSLPVAPSAYMYSHFRHVSGTPAPEGVRGVSISRLKILDTLIEQLSRMKKQPAPPSDMKGEDTEKRINALIEQYQSQIRSARAASAAVSYVSTASPVSGAIFSLAV